MNTCDDLTEHNKGFSFALVGMQIKEARRRWCCVMVRAAARAPTALIVKLFVWTFIRTVELDWG